MTALTITFTAKVVGCPPPCSLYVLESFKKPLHVRKGFFV